uniref:Uncharacterized protein n=1 Tax=Acrobeloides nanus TaxID=290746 RepID=A0A914DW11_9BILA
MYTPLFFAIIFLVLATSALDSNQVQCIQTCKNLGCLTGIYFGTNLQSVHPDWPVGCACQICNNNVQCNVNADAVNYCQGILGCKGADCDGGMFNCLACPTTTTVKFQRQAIDAANAQCNIACINRGCNAGFINQFSAAPGVPIVNCTCALCQGQTPCTSPTSGPDMANHCVNIGCPASANNANGWWNNLVWPNQTNSCDFGVNVCFSCPYP